MGRGLALLYSLSIVSDAFQNLLVYYMLRKSGLNSMIFLFGEQIPPIPFSLFKLPSAIGELLAFGGMTGAHELYLM